MTDDHHVRVWADGYAEQLDAIREAHGYDSNVPGSEVAAETEYLRRNRTVADQLRKAGLYPEGDINAYLTTGADRTDRPRSRE
jgi:hypothetical protein